MLEKSNDLKTNPTAAIPPVDYNDFEPTTGTKSCYFAVRKNRKIVGGIELPGLFDYVENFDKSWTIAVLITEIIALFFLARVISESSQDIPVLLLGLGALAFLAFDFASAWIHHFSVFPDRNRIENELLCIFPNMRVAADNQMKYHNYCKQDRFNLSVLKKYTPYLCVGILCLLAVVKCLLYIANVDVYFANQQMPNELQYGINGFVFLSYFFCVYAHIFHTGYYLAFRRLERSEKRDESRYYSARNQQQRKPFEKQDYESGNFSLNEFVSELTATYYAGYTELVPTDQNKRNKQINLGINTHLENNIDRLGGHKIIGNQDGSYNIIAHGLLTDEQLILMVQNQRTNLAKAAVALWGHYVQVNSTGIIS